jgi:hypothetical protein
VEAVKEIEAERDGNGDQDERELSVHTMPFG